MALKGLSREKRRLAEKSIVDELVNKHPDDLFVHLRYQRIMRGGTAEQRKALIERSRQISAKHRDNPDFAYLYARALIDTDTPQGLDIQVITLNVDDEIGKIEPTGRRTATPFRCCWRTRM